MQTHLFDVEPGVSLRWTHAPTPEARATVVLCQGRAEQLEKYADVIARLRSQNFEVFAMDWRGQGGSSRLTPDPSRGHLDRYEDLLLDLHLWLRDVVSPRQQTPRRFVLGHSLGGHVALRHLYHYPDAFERAVVTAPLIAPHSSLPPALVDTIARVMVHLGRGAEFAQRAREAARQRFEGNPYTSDSARFKALRDLLSGSPELTLGGPTWGFVRALCASSALLNAPGYARRITTPTLVITAGQDTVVDTGAAERWTQNLPNGERLQIDGSRHELLMERDSLREPVFEAIAKFLS